LDNFFQIQEHSGLIKKTPFGSMYKLHTSQSWKFDRYEALEQVKIGICEGTKFYNKLEQIN
jgi:hypothetical protein